MAQLTNNITLMTNREVAWYFDDLDLYKAWRADPAQRGPRAFAQVHYRNNGWPQGKQFRRQVGMRGFVVARDWFTKDDWKVLLKGDTRTVEQYHKTYADFRTPAHLDATKAAMERLVRIAMLTPAERTVTESRDLSEWSKANPGKTPADFL